MVTDFPWPKDLFVPYNCLFWWTSSSVRRINSDGCTEKFKNGPTAVARLINGSAWNWTQAEWVGSYGSSFLKWLSITMRTLDASCFAHSTGVPADWLELAMSLGRGIANSPCVLFFGISMAVSRTPCLIPEICANWRAIASLKTRLAMATTACTVERR